MLSFDPQRPVVVPRAAATVMVLRPGPDGAEVLCILRHPRSTFLGGMLAFPGGRVDAEDGQVVADEPLAARAGELAGAASARELAVAACRELLEEVSIVPVAGVDHAGAVALGERLKAGETFGAVVAGLGA
ncbi:MAG: hypothetical protein EOO75_10885, partial [Myxococcales bacterium]